MIPVFPSSWEMLATDQTLGRWLGETRMFDLIEEDGDQRLLEDFVRVITKLRGVNEIVRSSVGRGINIANSLLVQRFGSAEGFQASSDEEKDRYIGNLARAKEHFAQRWPTTAIGFSLFRMWLEALAEEDEVLAQLFSRGLAALSARSAGGAYSFAVVNSPKISARPPGMLIAA